MHSRPRLYLSQYRREKEHQTPHARFIKNLLDRFSNAYIGTPTFLHPKEMETLASVLKTRRNELNLTLREVEARTGLSNAYLSQIEHQKVLKPSPTTLMKLASAYRISYAHLMDLAGHPTRKRESKDSVFFRTSKGLREISKEEEEELLEFLRYLRSKRLER